MDARLQANQVGAALQQEILSKAVAPVHLQRETAQVAKLLLTQAQERPPLAPELSRRWSGTPARPGRRGSRRDAVDRRSLP